MSLTSLLADQNSWLWIWLRRNTNQSRWAGVVTELRKKAGDIVIQKKPGADLLQVGLAMTYVVGQQLQHPSTWVLESSLLRNEYAQILEDHAKLHPAAWALRVAMHEQVKRGGRPWCVGQSTIEDVTALSGGLGWIKPLDDDYPLKRHVPMTWSAALGGADVQFACPDANVQFRVKTGVFVVEDMLKAAIYGALDDNDPWKTFVYCLTRQRKQLGIDIQSLWEDIGFDPEDFRDACSIQAQEQEDDESDGLMIFHQPRPARMPTLKEHFDSTAQKADMDALLNFTGYKGDLTDDNDEEEEDAEDESDT